tara:strand:+ start:212 stop:514 length:303 start_codon:yes stop_codon:yes gene_type:complete
LICLILAVSFNLNACNISLSQPSKTAYSNLLIIRLYYFLLKIELKLPAIIPVGIATIPIPLIEITTVAIFPRIVIGYTSPYPIVVKVIVAYQKECKELLA